MHAEETYEERGAAHCRTVRRNASSRMQPHGARTTVREAGTDAAAAPGTGLSPVSMPRQHGHPADKEALACVLTLIVIEPRPPLTLQ